MDPRNLSNTNRHTISSSNPAIFCSIQNNHFSSRIFAGPVGVAPTSETITNYRTPEHATELDNNTN